MFYLTYCTIIHLKNMLVIISYWLRRYILSDCNIFLPNLLSTLLICYPYHSVSIETRTPLNVRKLQILSAEEGDPSRWGFKGRGPLMDLCSYAVFCPYPCTHSSAGWKWRGCRRSAAINFSWKYKLCLVIESLHAPPRRDRPSSMQSSQIWPCAPLIPFIPSSLHPESRTLLISHQEGRGLY